MIVRIHLENGTVQAFVQADEAIARTTGTPLIPSGSYPTARGDAGAYSKSVFVGPAIVRIDFVQQFCPCWKFPEGYSDIVELTEAEFRKHAQLDQPELMAKREQSTPVGIVGLLLRLEFRNTAPLHLMAELSVKLPAENQSFMRFLLSKMGF